MLAHGGIAMCGGRDWDRALLDNIAKPWLLDNFDLPENFSSDQSFKGLIRLAAWAAENSAACSAYSADDKQTEIDEQIKLILEYL